jgi:hypothetical protein
MKEKSAPPELVFEVLGRMQDAGVLEHVVLVGSWVMHFYRVGVAGFGSLGPVRSTDMDLMIPTPPRFVKTTNLAELVKDLGFIVQRGRTGFTKLIHSEMDMDFLVPERGRGSDEPYRVAGLGVTAQPIRYAGFLIENPTRVNDHGLVVRVPQPARFGLHKLIISQRRPNKDKAAKDLRQAIEVLTVLSRQSNWGKVKDLCSAMPKGWRTLVRKALEGGSSPDLLDSLFAA